MNASHPDPPAYCAGPPSLTLRAAIRQFNAGDYFTCHETLEDLWGAEEGAVRQLYQGILQVSVGMHHLRRGNQRGALALLSRGTGLLRAFPTVCQGLDLTAFILETEQLRIQLEIAGLERTRTHLDQQRPRICLVE